MEHRAGGRRHLHLSHGCSSGLRTVWVLRAPPASSTGACRPVYQTRPREADPGSLALATSLWLSSEPRSTRARGCPGKPRDAGGALRGGESPGVPAVPLGGGPGPCRSPWLGRQRPQEAFCVSSTPNRKRPRNGRSDHAAAVARQQDYVPSAAWQPAGSVTHTHSHSRAGTRSHTSETGGTPGQGGRVPDVARVCALARSAESLPGRRCVWTR